MRLRNEFVVLLFGLLALAWAAPASAEGFLDLPGMGAAGKLVGDGEAATGPAAEQSAVQAGSGSASASVDQAATTSDDAKVTAGPISKLPGMGAAPVIGIERAKASLPVPVPGLEAWAGLGTLAALGGLAALRRWGVL